jgi:hypothetical protein
VRKPGFGCRPAVSLPGYWTGNGQPTGSPGRRLANRTVEALEPLGRDLYQRSCAPFRAAGVPVGLVFTNCSAPRLAYSDPQSALHTYWPGDGLVDFIATSTAASAGRVVYVPTGVWRVPMACAQERWRAVNAPHLVALVRAGTRFEKGVLVEREEANAA